MRNPATSKLGVKLSKKVQRKYPLDRVAEVVLPDHIYMLWELPEGDSDYPVRIRLAKAAFSRGFARDEHLALGASRLSKGEREIWQRRYWEHTIRDGRDLEAHLDYIHFNPVKHGLARTPADWPHSTFQKFVGSGVYSPNWSLDPAADRRKWPFDD